MFIKVVPVDVIFFFVSKFPLGTQNFEQWFAHLRIARSKATLCYAFASFFHSFVTGEFVYRMEVSEKFTNQKLNEAKLRDRIFFVFFSLLLLYLSLCWYFNVWIHFNSLAKRNAFYCFRAELFQVLGEKKSGLKFILVRITFVSILVSVCLLKKNVSLCKLAMNFPRHTHKTSKLNWSWIWGMLFWIFTFSIALLRMLLCVRWMRILPYARIFKASKISMVAHNGADP